MDPVDIITANEDHFGGPGNPLGSVHPETRYFAQDQGTRRLQPQEYIVVFRGLQSERDAEIGQNGRLWMGTS